MFAADDGTTGIEPWVTNGTAAGTMQLMDINTLSTQGSSPADFSVVGNLCFFSATTQTVGPGGWTGRELYVTDGTPAGTKLVRDINPGGSSSSPMNLVAANGRLFFSAITAAAGRELWTSNGSAAGTSMVIDLNGGTAFGFVASEQSMIAFGNGVMFTGRTAATGYEICVSDGSAAGTILLDFVPGTGNSGPFAFVVMNGIAYFRATDGTNGIELMRSNGTLAGTALVKDIMPGTGSSSPGPFAVLNNRLYFFATDTTREREPWVSDGTGAGTTLLKDINPGTPSSTAGPLVRAATACSSRPTMARRALSCRRPTARRRARLWCAI